MDKLQDLKVSGVSRMNGGKFDYVDISGVGKIFGDLEANRLNISGSGKVEGSVKSDKIKIDGNSSIKGDVECTELTCSGNAKIEGQLEADIINTNGMCRVGGKIKAHTIDSKGYIKTKSGLEADEFISDGAFKIAELLNASKIDVKISYGSSAKEMGGEEIVVRKSKSHNFNFFLTLFGVSNKLESDLIEGTNIYLEYTDAKIVRGENIKIGPKCTIELIEYSGTLEVLEGSTVKEQKKV